MTRTLTAGMVSEVTAATLEPILLLELIFDSGPLRLWSGQGDLVWNGVTWTGAGQLWSLDSVTESAGIQASGVRFSLSGVDPAIISLALAEPYQGRAARLWLGTVSAGLVVATPYKMLDGLMDVMTHADEGETASLSLAVESRLIDLERPRERRYTPEDQALDYAGDKGFDFVAGLQEKEVVWRTR